MAKNVTRLTIQLYWQYVRKQEGLLAFVLIGIFTGTASNVGIYYVFKLIVDRISATGAPIDFANIISLLIPLALFLIINMLGWRTGLYALSILEPKVMAELVERSFYEIHKHSFNFFSNEFVGSLVKKVTRLGRSVENFIDIVAVDMFQMLIRLTLVVVILYILSPILGTIMLVWAILFIIVNYVASTYKLEHYDKPRLQADSNVTGQLADTISNSANIKLFSTRHYEQQRFSEASQDWRHKTTRTWIFSQHIEFIQNAMMIALELILIYISLKLWQKGVLSIGDFVLIQSYLTEMFIFIWDFGRNVERMYEAFADAQEMVEIINTPHEIRDTNNAKPIKLANGKIIFQDVTFSYHENEHVISKLNLTIPAGETVALIGPSGGGKTTIIKLLIRLYDLDGGKILLDDQNIAEVTQDSLRSQIALVPQDAILFHRSLMDNIRYGRLTATDEEVIEAAKQAYCHKFINNFEKGYNTLVGERGVKLSGGERQRIAIARAILSNAKILVLDEATSNLDVHSEKLIQAALQNLKKNKTTIIIAHRLSTVRNANHIIAMEDGKIAEQGNHDELLQKQGLYYSLWQLNNTGQPVSIK
ncbi:MAG: ABC transporter ATP-binding protein [bacterium]|nr:ABC transporter ATP-binding protein [bacterium]